jgi:hypothetical protein
MQRTEILLTDEQHYFLQQAAQEAGVSLSEIVCRAVDTLRRQDPTPTQRALDLLGAFEADRTDVSLHHDHYFTAGTEADSATDDR